MVSQNVNVNALSSNSFEQLAPPIHEEPNIRETTGTPHQPEQADQEIIADQQPLPVEIIDEEEVLNQQQQQQEILNQAVQNVSFSSSLHGEEEVADAPQPAAKPRISLLPKVSDSTPPLSPSKNIPWPMQNYFIKDRKSAGNIPNNHNGNGKSNHNNPESNVVIAETFDEYCVQQIGRPIMDNSMEIPYTMSRSVEQARKGEYHDHEIMKGAAPRNDYAAPPISPRQHHNFLSRPGAAKFRGEKGRNGKRRRERSHGQFGHERHETQKSRRRVCGDEVFYARPGDCEKGRGANLKFGRTRRGHLLEMPQRTHQEIIGSWKGSMQFFNFVLQIVQYDYYLFSTFLFFGFGFGCSRHVERQRGPINSKRFDIFPSFDLIRHQPFPMATNTNTTTDRATSSRSRH